MLAIAPWSLVPIRMTESDTIFCFFWGGASFGVPFVSAAPPSPPDVRLVVCAAISFFISVIFIVNLQFSVFCRCDSRFTIAFSNFNLKKKVRKSS